MNTVLILELFIGILVSFTLLGIFIWGAKKGQFDDSKKAMDGLLFDTQEDLENAVKKEKKIKALKEKAAKREPKE
ncbi:MAG: cbb3-type cytochrome oxidase assembly protein CcoS [Epsilonproteobacteria bacterium]|nr:cbb3-type cytochrome oxidase assembly protein CcoS [Campylobacterota bacterium]